MKILIAGGTGLIGSTLAESFQSDGHDIWIISRNPDNVKQPYQGLSWDEPALLEGLTGADAVINLAGSSLAGENPLKMRWTPKRKNSITSSRISAGNNLVQAIKKLDPKPQIFLQASAIGYYGNKGFDPADENSDPGSDFLAEVCQGWEASTAELDQLGVRRIVIRIGLVLSQSGGLLSLLALPFRLFLGGRIGPGNQYLSWIHIQDVVKGIKYLVEQQHLEGIYNLTSPNPETNLEFSRLAGITLRRPVWLPVPTFALRVALGEAATLALDGRPVYPNKLLKAGYQFQYQDLEDCLQDLL